MYLSRHDIANLYESRLIREMDSRIIDYLNDNKEELPFSNIFKDDELRIVIPLISDPIAKDIIEILKRIKDYGGLDLDSGEVIRKIKLDPKYGGGEKEQKIKIGSVVSKLKISEEDKKKYLEWLALYKDNLKDTLGTPKYSIILSRAPIDVLRMSDFDSSRYKREIKSCHSQGGQYFECAVQEAINGGAVAFLVNTKELNTSLENGFGLNSDEFFSDYERDPNDDDFSPYARLRIRRLVSDDGKEFAIPDYRIYGDNTIPGFYRTLRKFLQEKQPVSIDDFWNSDWEKRGGTYYDSGNDIEFLIGKYFDVDTPVGYSYRGAKNIIHNRDDRSIEKERKREISHFSGNILQQECEDIKDSANNRMSHCEVSFFVEEGDEDPYIFPGATGSYQLDVNIPEIEHLISFSIDDYGDYRKVIRGDYDEEYSWSGLFNWFFNNQGIELSRFEISNGVMEFEIYEENIFFTVREYVRFVDNILDFDRFLSRLDEDKWSEIFEEIGILSSTDEQALQYMIDNGSEELSYDDSSRDRHVEWNLRIDSLNDETFETYQDHNSYGVPSVSRNEGYMGDTFVKMLLNYLKAHYKPNNNSSDNQQQTFKNFFESYYQPVISSDHREFMHDLNFDKIQIKVDSSGYGGTNVVRFSVRIDVPIFDFTNVRPILFLDKHQDDLRHMASYAYILEHRYINLDDSKYSNYVNGLKRVYGKYLM